MYASELISSRMPYRREELPSLPLVLVVVTALVVGMTTTNAFVEDNVFSPPRNWKRQNQATTALLESSQAIMGDDSGGWPFRFLLVMVMDQQTSPRLMKRAAPKDTLIHRRYP
jgi:hypothetical protein